MKKSKKSICLILVLFTLLTSNLGCVNASMYSEEQHLARVERRIRRRLPKIKYGTDIEGKIIYTSINGEGYPKYSICEYEGFEVYPLYDQNEELNFILVEFEPYGFFIVTILRDLDIGPLAQILGKTIYSVEVKQEWSPYNYEATPDGNERIYEYDENGEQIIYKKSPYYITGNIDKRKYLLRIGSESFVCAVKEGNKYLNLINNKTIDDLSKNQPILDICEHFTGFKKYI